tara:strand:+ start:837 stop:1025 length:189 start_codon:yes stop_codon:yes gene_type:complete
LIYKEFITNGKISVPKIKPKKVDLRINLGNLILIIKIIIPVIIDKRLACIGKLLLINKDKVK